MALAVNLLFTVCPTVHVTTDPPSIGPRPPLRGGLNISTCDLAQCNLLSLCQTEEQPSRGISPSSSIKLICLRCRRTEARPPKGHSYAPITVLDSDVPFRSFLLEGARVPRKSVGPRSSVTRSALRERCARCEEKATACKDTHQPDHTAGGPYQGMRDNPRTFADAAVKNTTNQTISS